MLENFVVGFSFVLMPMTLLLTLLGVIIGIIFGAIPGLTGTMAVALFLPLTFEMSPVNSLATLMGMYIGSCSGGLISAILLNIPGIPSSIATTFDGHPMAARGEAGKALGTAIVFSFLGGLFSFIVLFFVAPPLAEWAVKFGPYEYFAIAIFALTLISSVSGDSPLKGLIAGLIGMSLALVGISPIDGFPRFTFGIIELSAGLSLLPALVGLFAVSELLKEAQKKKDLSQKPPVTDYRIRGFGFTWREFREQARNFVRSSLIGTGVGILPGIGGSSSNLMSYIAAKKSSKHPEKFGTGIMDGIVASESANNAAVGGALVPLLTLGIPGDALTAMLIGALMVHGLTPGPLLFQNSGDIVYSVFASLIIANFMMIIVEFFGMRFFVKMLNIPKYILLPVIIVLCVVGAFGLNNRVFDAWTLFLFGTLGYLLNTFKFPLTPTILGFILTPLAETYLRRGLQMSEGNFFPFFTKPISAVFLTISILSILFAIRKGIKDFSLLRRSER